MSGAATAQLVVRIALAVIFIVAGVLHFVALRQYASIVPAWVPTSPDFVVQVTGVMEVAGGVGLLIPALLRPAAICLMLFLVAVFPANVVAAQHHVPLHNPLWGRALAQVVLIAAIGWVSLFPAA